MKITIIGCGWLGIQVGEYLSKQGHSIYGSYRSEAQKEKISKTSINGFNLDLDPNSQISTEITDNTDLLILPLPPIKREDPNYYATVLGNCVLQFPKTTNVIFTSSIGVYPSKEVVFTEAYSFEDDGNSVVRNAEIELQKHLENRLTILRLGGLIGPNRHPIKSMQGKSISNDGKATVNLIHSEDISRAINSILVKNDFGKCYNLVFPLEISKNIYYPSMVEKYNLNKIIFGAEKSVNRRVDGQLICKNGNFNYLKNPINFNEQLF
ncbi:MAG: nucleoside-diphosphate-sugar epimerase [Crocinitomicaceae bacterium]